MRNYEKEILEKLVKKYYKSGHGLEDKKGLVSVKPSEFVKDYNDRFCDISEIEKFNEAAFSCEEKGFLKIRQDSKKGESLRLQKLCLREEKTEDIEQYLFETYGYIPVSQVRKEADALLKEYPESDKCSDLIKDDLSKKSRAGKLKEQDIKKYSDILKTTSFLENNKEYLYPREISQRLFGDTKYMERNSLFGQTARVLNAAEGYKTRDPGYDKNILEKYCVLNGSDELRIKGNFVAYMNRRRVLSGFANRFVFFPEDVSDIKKIKIKDKVFMTVENLTSWKRLDAENITFFYLGGYVDRSQADFLKKIYKDNPDIQYFHFGDIDPYGFAIFKNLCERTGIPFKTYKMDESELKNEKYKDFLKPLTDEDISHMKALLDDPAFHDIAAYMSDNNVKLEQEAVSLDLVRSASDSL